MLLAAISFAFSKSICQFIIIIIIIYTSNHLSLNVKKKRAVTAVSAESNENWV